MSLHVSVFSQKTYMVTYKIAKCITFKYYCFVIVNARQAGVKNRMGFTHVYKTGGSPLLMKENPDLFYKKQLLKQA